jgi:sRNA-binding protein
MDYQEALAIMEETVSHRVRQLEMAFTQVTMCRYMCKHQIRRYVMDYQEALAIMEETVSHRVRQLEERAQQEETFEARKVMKRRAEQVHEAFNKVRNG